MPKAQKPRTAWKSRKGAVQQKELKAETPTEKETERIPAEATGAAETERQKPKGTSQKAKAAGI